MLAILEEALRESPTVEHVVLAPFELDAFPGRAPGSPGRLGDALPAHVHLGHDRHAEGRRARAGRLPRLDRPRGGLPGGCPRGRRRALRDGHGLDHGSVDRRRRRRRRRDDRLRRGRARLADPDRLWRTVEQEGVTSLGLSPTLARALLPHGAPTSDLSSLRTFVTTGEPWNPEPYRWLFEDVGGSRVPIINCTGGTEVGACFLSPTPDRPDQGVLGRRAGARDGDGHRRRRGRFARRHRRGRRARLPRTVPRDDARLLARPGPVPRDVLVADPGCLGARRLGVRRRRRFLVPARPLGRHAQHCRQADRAG